MRLHVSKNMADDAFLPKARNENLVIKELPVEVLVYDLKTDRAHCLNQSATLTWKHCDGKTSVAEMTSILTAELKTQVDEDTVWLALKQLGKARLLEQPVIAPIEKSRLSRREVIRKLGLGATIAAPLVMSIIAPTAASAATCHGTGFACSPNGNSTATCCSQCCAGGSCRVLHALAGGASCTQDCQCASANCLGGGTCHS